jgi:thiosulfate dehydrogenase
LLHFGRSRLEVEKSEEEIQSANAAGIAEDFEIPPFDDTEGGRMAEYGYHLMTETYNLVGPETELAITGNRLSCSSCHLNAGLKPFAAPYIGLSGVFPIYIGRENKVVSLEERINGCFERSMNGRSVDVNSKEMRAMVCYIKHISNNIPVGNRIVGQGFVELVAPDRAADLDKGALIYQNNCLSCHGAHGEGLRGSIGNREGGYVYPPLWGDDSYNDGAGMARVITAAKFIKGNMPLGVTHDNPLLSDEEAYDVAAFINSHERPVKADKELDYPDLTKKPKDCPYPPYNDGITQIQHKFGPFDF